jgi:outer membrane protein
MKQPTLPARIEHSVTWWIAITLLILSLSVNAQTTGAFPVLLTQEQAVALALTYHPSLRGAQASSRSASAGITQDQSNYFPALNLSAGGNRTDGAFVFNPSTPIRNQSYNNYTAALTLQQTLYDFGKTSGRVSASEQFYDASVLDFQSTRENVIANVQLAYIGFVQAKRLVKVSEETVTQMEEHLKQAKAFYSVGTRPRFDVTTAEVNLANANVARIRARNQMRVAKIQLENAIGIYSTTPYDVRDAFDTLAFTMSLDSVKITAVEFRSELRSAQARYASTRSLTSAAWRLHLPTISLSGTWTWSGFDFPLQSRWVAGATLTVPLFQGFGISSQVEQAEATEDVAQASLDLLTESVVLEAEQNYLSLKEADERIGASAKFVTQAKENLKLAEGRYNSGVGSPIEITDAQINLSNAQITYIQSLSDYNSSLIRLRRAMGVIGR